MTHSWLQPSRGRRVRHWRSLKRSEIIARRITESVRIGEMSAGAFLPAEAEMLQEYGVSRGTLREALRILEVHGFITIKPGPSGGPRLADMAAPDFGRTATFYYQAMGVTFGELAEARLLLEPLMAGLAAKQAAKGDLSALRNALDKYGESADQDERVELSEQLHLLIGRMCGNRVLALLGESFAEIFEMYALNTLSADESSKVLRVHERIVAAIAKGDSDLAASLMERHMRETARDLANRHPDLMDAVVDWV